MIPTLRKAITTTNDEAIRTELTLVCAELKHALTTLAATPTADNLRAVNGFYVRGLHVMDHATRDAAERQARTT